MIRGSLVALLFLTFSSNIHAQGSYHMMRYDDDYEYLKNQQSRGWYDKLKYTPMDRNQTGYISAGGEVRFQYFKFNNEDWGDAPQDKDGFILTRFLFHTDLHFNKSVRVFVQLQSSLSDGRAEAPPRGERNELDVHQAFAEFDLMRSASMSLRLRVGRQEMSYGASRLVSVREGPNNRQAFDGGKLLINLENIQGDIFLADYVGGEKGIFNDKVLSNSEKLWGAYWTFRKIPLVQNLDLYYLGFSEDNARWNDLEGKELRHSIGARISGQRGRIAYDVEGVYQFGDMASSSVEAWTLSSNTSYKLGTRKESGTIGLKTELISGDQKLNDGKIQSFNPLFPRGAYFGYAALIGPSNLFDLHPSWTIPISESFESDIDYDIFWRYSSRDGIYNQDTEMIYPAGDHRHAFVGHQVSGNVEYVGNDHIFVRAEVTWFLAGSYLKSVSAGKDIFFIGITTRFRF